MAASSADFIDFNDAGPHQSSLASPSLYMTAADAQLHIATSCCSIIYGWLASLATTTYNLLLPMSSPTQHMSQLSISDMPLSSTSQILRRDLDMEIGALDDDNNTILSPAGRLYSLKNLSPSQRDDLIETFFTEDIDDYQMILHEYSLHKDTAKFEVLELTRHTISIPSSPVSDTVGITCNKCRNAAHECRAGLWLFDQISNQVLCESSEPLVMTPSGYPEELGDMFEAITEHDIDTLAHGLQYNDIYRNWGPSSRRFQESKEILASLHGVPVSMYSRSLDPGDEDDDIVKDNDLETTVFRMLLRNDQFFKYFRSVLKPGPNINRFQQLRHKADHILAAHRAFLTDRHSSPLPCESQNPKNSRATANSLSQIITQIEATLSIRSGALESFELDSAARTLIHILHQVVNLNVGRVPMTTSQAEHTLFDILVGDRDNGFVVDVLQKFIPKRLLTNHEQRLEEIEANLQGAPLSWHRKLTDLINKDRRTHALTRTPTSQKRSSEGGDRHAKRAR